MRVDYELVFCIRKRLDHPTHAILGCGIENVGEELGIHA